MRNLITSVGLVHSSPSPRPAASRVLEPLVGVVKTNQLSEGTRKEDRAGEEKKTGASFRHPDRYSWRQQRLLGRSDLREGGGGSEGPGADGRRGPNRLPAQAGRSRHPFGGEKFDRVREGKDSGSDFEVKVWSSWGRATKLTHEKRSGEKRGAMGELDAVTLMDELRAVFESGKTRSAEWRIEQLNGVIRMFDDNVKEIGEAVRQDMDRPFFEMYTADYFSVKDSAKNAAKNVKKWMKPEKVSASLAALPASATIRPEPLGVVLVISSWNFPFLLAVDPMIGAIAAGNCVVVKPSELAPASSALLARIIPKYLDSSAIRVVEGGVPETTALLDQAWDHIFYTGNPRVGKIILAAAAKHLTPTTLELGGKSPCIVDSTPDLDVVAKRITWGKWASNNGQACIAPDYLLVEESVVPKLITKIKETLKVFYGEDPSTSPDISRIINTRHFHRLAALLNHEGTLEKVVHGGQVTEKTLYIAPTVILDPPMDAPIMQEEIFGPLMVILTVKNVDEAIKIVKSGPKPLALYMFSTSSSAVERVVEETSSGGVTINDCLMHFTQPDLPFGGVGNSGMGAYHGKHSFDVFSHKKAVLYRYLMGDVAVKYPPYTVKKQKIILAILSGNVFNLILTLLGYR